MRSIAAQRTVANAFKAVTNLKTFRLRKYEGWNFNSGNYLFTTDTK